MKKRMADDIQIQGLLANHSSSFPTKLVLVIRKWNSTSWSTIPHTSTFRLGVCVCVCCEKNILWMCVCVCMVWTLLVGFTSGRFVSDAFTRSCAQQPLHSSASLFFLSLFSWFYYLFHFYLNVLLKSFFGHTHTLLRVYLCRKRRRRRSDLTHLVVGMCVY